MSNPIKLLKKILRPLYMKYRFIKYSHIMKKTSKIEKGNCILFICQYEACWNKFKNIFLKLVEKNIKTYLLIVNDDNTTKEYYKKIFTEKETIFEKEFPQYCIKYKKDILKELNPSYVIYTRPYNAYLPKDLRSYNVIKYSKTALINYYYPMTMDYFMINDISSTINLFITSVIYEKDYFDKLCNYGVSRGYQKAINYGFPQFENLYENKKPCFFDDKKNIKVIWTPRWIDDEKSHWGSNFMELYKIIFDYFLNNSKYSFVFRPHPLMFNNLIERKKITVEDKEEIIRRLNESNNAIYDCSPDYLSMFYNSDVLITDFSSIVPEYFITGKPIIYCEKYNSYDYFNPKIKEIIDCNYLLDDVNDLINLLESVINDDSKKDLRNDLVNTFLVEHKNASSKIVDELI